MSRPVVKGICEAMADDALPDDEVEVVSTEQPDLLERAVRQLRSDTKSILEFHYMHGYNLRDAFMAAGAENRYNNKDAYAIKKGVLAGAYISHLMDRQAVIAEFGKDDIKAIRLMKLRDKAEREGDTAAAIRAHDMILKLVGAFPGKGPVGGGERPQVDKGKREEILARLAEIQKGVTGESPDIPEEGGVSLDAELVELATSNQLRRSEEEGSDATEEAI